MSNMTKEKAFSIGLPKWPQAIIHGKTVTIEQASEIIRRTDEFFIGCYGNDDAFYKNTKKMLGCPVVDEFNTGDIAADADAFNDAFEKFLEKWNYIPLSYLMNSWVSCSWIGGPHGFCHPDGTIQFQDNIGKYPNVEDVYNDLVALGAAFPYLEMTCTLMNDENVVKHKKALITLVLKNGEVTFRHPTEADQEVIPDNVLNREFIKRLNSVKYFERGLSDEYLQQWVKFKPDLSDT